METHLKRRRKYGARPYAFHDYRNRFDGSNMITEASPFHGLNARGQLLAKAIMIG